MKNNNELKIGDRVRCVDVENGYISELTLEAGKIYTINEVWEDGAIHLKEFHDSWFHCSRFEKIPGIGEIQRMDLVVNLEDIKLHEKPYGKYEAGGSHIVESVDGPLIYLKEFPKRPFKKSRFRVATKVEWYKHRFPDLKEIWIDERKSTVVVLLQSGTKAKAKVSPGDEFNVDVGILMAYVKATSGSYHKAWRTQETVAKTMESVAKVVGLAQRKKALKREISPGVSIGGDPHYNCLCSRVEPVFTTEKPSEANRPTVLKEPNTGRPLFLTSGGVITADVDEQPLPPHENNNRRWLL